METIMDEQRQTELQERKGIEHRAKQDDVSALHMSALGC